LKTGTKTLIQQAVETELQVFLGEYAKVTDLRGRQTVVRNGALPERESVTGVGNVTVVRSGMLVAWGRPQKR